MAAENERLRRLRERVEAQELKLRRLRALRGQLDQTNLNNVALSEFIFDFVLVNFFIGVILRVKMQDFRFKLCFDVGCIIHVGYILNWNLYRIDDRLAPYVILNIHIKSLFLDSMKIFSAKLCYTFIFVKLHL